MFNICLEAEMSLRLEYLFPGFQPFYLTPTKVNAFRHRLQIDIETSTIFKALIAKLLTKTSPDSLKNSKFLHGVIYLE